jgi:hypothetical protein
VKDAVRGYYYGTGSFFILIMEASGFVLEAVEKELNQVKMSYYAQSDLRGFVPIWIMNQTLANVVK